MEIETPSDAVEATIPQRQCQYIFYLPRYLGTTPPSLLYLKDTLVKTCSSEILSLNLAYSRSHACQASKSRGEKLIGASHENNVHIKLLLWARPGAQGMLYDSWVKPHCPTLNQTLALMVTPDGVGVPFSPTLLFYIFD